MYANTNIVGIFSPDLDDPRGGFLNFRNVREGNRPELEQMGGSHFGKHEFDLEDNRQMAWFKRQDNEIESSQEKRVRTEGLWVKCEGCDQYIFKADLESNQQVCPKCG